MTYSNALNATTEKLSQNNNVTARLDALILIEYVTNMPRAYLLSELTEQLTADQLLELHQLVAKRVNGLPIAYIIGKKEFYGRTFIVDKNVLIPRPDSESFIELFTKHPPRPNQRLLDIGTGSGCLAISAKLEFPHLSVTATDLSKKALVVAQKNATALDADITFIQSDLFANIIQSYDYIFANLPYVPSVLDVSNEVLNEPRKAVFSGIDGLDCYRAFFKTIANFLKPNGIVYTESLRSQHASMQQLASTAHLDLVATDNLVQMYKCNAI